MASSPVGDDPLAHLNEAHKTAVRDFLTLFRHKLEKQTKEVDIAFRDCKDMRLLEDTYTLEDVSVIFDGLRDIVRSTLRAQLEKYSHQNALYLRQLFLQAEGQSATLKGDLALLDDEKLLESIKKIDHEAPKTGIPEGGLPSAKKLAAISGAVDIKLVTKVKELEESNARLQTRFEKLTEQLRASQAEAATLRESGTTTSASLADAKRDLENLRGSNTSAQLAEIESLRKQLSERDGETKEALAKAKQELKEAQDRLTARVNDAPQFKELMKMVQEKNAQIRELRAHCTANSLPLPTKAAAGAGAAPVKA